MKLLLTFLLMVLHFLSYSQIDEECKTPNYFNDSIYRIFFPSNYNYNRDELRDIKFWADYKNSDSIVLIDLDCPTIKAIEKDLRNQLTTLINNSYGQSNKLNIETNLQNYNRQYFCYVDQNGDKIVLINFILQKPNESSVEISRPIFYDDGGSRYWKLKYNILTKSFFNLRINGNG